MLAEQLHFTKAALLLHVAQPALSHQIKQLEEELGTQLVERSDRRVRLTAAGEVFRRRAARILERAVSRQSVPQRFVLAFLSTVPQRIPVLHDLKFSTLLDAQAGSFFNVFAGLDTNGDTNTLNNRPGTLGRDTLKGPSIVSWDMRVERELHFNERLRGEFTFDLFNVTNRVNVSDLNTVCECDLPASDFSPASLKSTIASLNPLYGFDTARQTLNPFQFQYGFKLRF